MRYWQYRGYDKQYRIKYGVESATTFESLALHLRQRGIFIIEATTISKAQYLSLFKTYPRPPEEPKMKASIFQRIISRLLGRMS